MTDAEKAAILHDECRGFAEELVMLWSKVERFDTDGDLTEEFRKTIRNANLWVAVDDRDAHRKLGELIARSLDG